MWCGAAPQHTPSSPTPSVDRLAREVGHLVARAGERVQRGRERAPARQVGDRRGILEGLHARLLGGRAVGDGQRRDGHGHRGADVGQQRQHRARAARAVEPDDVGARRLERAGTPRPARRRRAWTGRGAG